jgi:2-succinyl-5-enolpyruvyl-6-hydroxy-3-cyclohexene-1-carboxylate synthase
MSRSFESIDLVLIGGLPASRRGEVRDFALRLGAPVYAEPLSGLREDAALRDLLVMNERSLGAARTVLRIGNVPTLRYWRDLDEKHRDVEVIHVTDLPFTGLPRGEILRELPSAPCAQPPAPFDYKSDREQYRQREELLDSEPQSEQAIIREISRTLPRGSRVYLGNSLPIREWDLAATREDRGYEIGANRGANGIDGQLSTFFGWCKPGAHNVAIVGDLTAIYDLNAPWIVPQLDVEARVIIINNGGGRIFERVASLRRLDKRLIINEHRIRFDAWAAMFGIDVDERLPDLEATRRVADAC